MAGSLSARRKERSNRKRARRAVRLISRYLSITEAEAVAFPIFSEHFEVASAFAALGASIGSYRDRKKRVSLKRKLRRASLKFMANKAMERLRGIVSRAVTLEKTSSSERGELQRQLDEVRARRSEDARANDKVMAMFSTQEQQWKSEQKRLKAEVVSLRKDLAGCIRRLQAGREKRPLLDISCLECKAKQLSINDLRDQIKEKDFLMAAVREDADIEHGLVAQKLADAEEVLETMKQDLAAETGARKAAEGMSEVWKEKLSAEFEAHEGAVDKLRQKLTAEAEALEAECAKLKEEMAVQERVLTTVLARIDSLKVENAELVEKLDAAKEQSSLARVCSRMRHFDVQAVQQREQQVYAEQVVELERQVQYYQQRVQQLEECALLHLDQCSTRKDSEVGSAKDFHLDAAKNLLAQYIDAERARDLELGKWRKLYSAAKMAMSIVNTEPAYRQEPAVPSKELSIKQFIDAATARQAAELTEQHWYEIDTFERLMKAKDERMEGLRIHLLSLERQVKMKESELKEMAGRFDAEAALREEMEARLQETRQELQAFTEESTSNNRMPGTTKKKRSRNEDKEPELDMRALLEQSEAELHGKDLQLAFVEAKLVQSQMQCKKEKKSRENLVADVLKEKEMLENLVKEGGQQASIRNAIAAACLEVEKLSPSRRTAHATPDEENNKLIAITTEQEKIKAKDLASILAKQLEDYHVLLQKINEHSIQAESAAKAGSISLVSLLPRSLELQHHVQNAGRKLSLIHASSNIIAPSKDQTEPSRLLQQHLSQIQQRLETKVANLVARS